MRVSHPIPVDGSVRITLPDQLLIEDEAVSMPTCAPVEGFGATLTCECPAPCSGPTRDIRLVNLGFAAAFTPTNLLSFTIEGVRNPVSLGVTDSFRFYTTSSAGFTIDAWETGATITMDSVNELERVTLMTSSEVNGAVDTRGYTLSIRTSSPLVDGDILHLWSPSSVTPPPTPVCVWTSLIASSDECEIMGETRNKDTFIELTFSGGRLDSGTDIVFEIENFTNPISTWPSDNFLVELLDSSNALISDYTSDLTVTTSIPSNINTISITNEN